MKPVPPEPAVTTTVRLLRPAQGEPAGTVAEPGGESAPVR